MTGRQSHHSSSTSHSSCVRTVSSRTGRICCGQSCSNMAPTMRSTSPRGSPPNPRHPHCVPTFGHVAASLRKSSSVIASEKLERCLASRRALLLLLLLSPRLLRRLPIKRCRTRLLRSSQLRPAETDIRSSGTQQDDNFHHFVGNNHPAGRHYQLCKGLKNPKRREVPEDWARRRGQRARLPARCRPHHSHAAAGRVVSHRHRQKIRQRVRRREVQARLHRQAP